MYTDRGEMMADKVARWLNQRRLGGSRPVDLPTYSVALEALIAWEEKFPARGGLQGSVQRSRLPSQFAFQCCNLPQLLNTQKNVPLHLNLHFNLQF